MLMDLDQLFEYLTAYQGEVAFNQYRDVHPDLDCEGGAQVRCRNLRAYLTTFAEARFLLVGEAAGYAGCRFSGIPFTSESQLTGPGRLGWADGCGLARSSRSDRPWIERSASMVWEVLGERRDIILWNAFPWHPFGPRGPLSNWHPGRDLGAGLEVLHCLLELLPGARPYAGGRVAERALADIGLQAPYIRHPSRGGKARFAEGVAALPPE